MRMLFAVSLCLLSAPAFAQNLDDASKGKTQVGTVRFESGSGRLTKESKEQVAQAVEALAQHPNGEVLIVGHTDRHGSAEKNLALSKSRADIVRRELERRGVRANRIQFFGAGYTLPLSTEETPEADALNRRADLWVGPEPPVAWVSWLSGNVEYQVPGSTVWEKAKIDTVLNRGAQLRTTDSAAEITFNRGNKVYVGPRTRLALSTKAGPDRRGVAAIALEEGDLMFRLYGAETKAIEVTSPQHKLTLASGTHRVSYRPGGSTTAVAVQKGSAKAGNVTVQAGYGTILGADGKAQKPTQAPAAPTWAADPALTLQGEPVILYFQPAPDTSETIIEFSDATDTEGVRPIQFFKSTEPRYNLENLNAGLYRVRLVGKNSDGLAGPASPSKVVAVAPKPVDFLGNPVAMDGRTLNVQDASLVRVPEVAGLKINRVDEVDPLATDRRLIRLSAAQAPGEIVLGTRPKLARTRTSTANRPKRTLWPEEKPVTIVTTEKRGFPGQFFVGLLGGVEDPRQTNLGPAALLEAGVRFTDRDGGPSTDLGLRAGYVGTSAHPILVTDGSLHQLQLSLLANFGWTFGNFRPRFGATFGLRSLSKSFDPETAQVQALSSAQMNVTAFGGAGYRFGAVELGADLGYAWTDLDGVDRKLNAFMALAGVKFFFGDNPAK